jgi:hypothetical protein
MSIDWELELLEGSSKAENNLIKGNYDIQLKEFLSNWDGDSKSSLITFLKSLDKENVFGLGIAGVLAFMQAGWTGPALSWSSFSLLQRQVDEKAWNKYWLDELYMDGEEPYSLTPDPFLLALAKIVFSEFKFDEFQTGSWWVSRYAFAHQKVLDNPANTLREIYLESIGMTKVAFVNKDGERNQKFVARIYLEEGIFYHFHGNDQKALVSESSLC